MQSQGVESPPGEGESAPGLCPSSCDDWPFGAHFGHSSACRPSTLIAALGSIVFSCVLLCVPSLALRTALVMGQSTREGRHLTLITAAETLFPNKATCAGNVSFWGATTQSKQVTGPSLSLPVVFLCLFSSFPRQSFPNETSFSFVTPSLSHVSDSLILLCSNSSLLLFKR